MGPLAFCTYQVINSDILLVAIADDFLTTKNQNGNFSVF